MSALLLTSFTSCKNSHEKKERIAVVISTLNNPWFVVLGQTAVARCEELGYEATLFDSQNNPSKEAEHFDNILASGYKAILFNPTDADGSAVNAKAAARQGIPVFCMDREINVPGACVTQILSDNYSGCITLGEYFVEVMGKQGNYVEILGLVGDNNTWARSRGFHSVVDCFDRFHMLAQQTGGIFHTTSSDEGCQRSVVAALCKGSADAFLRQMETFHSSMPVEFGIEEKLFVDDDLAEVVEERGSPPLLPPRGFH